MSNRRAAGRAALVLAVIACTSTAPPIRQRLRLCEYDLGDELELRWRDACMRACRWGWVDFAVGIPEDEEQSIIITPCGPGVSEGLEA